MWEKDIEIVDDEVIFEGIWKISKKKNDDTKYCLSINDHEELRLINGEIDKLQNAILLGVSQDVEYYFEQCLDNLRKRRFDVLSKI